MIPVKSFLIMLINRNLSLFIIIILFVIVETDFITINWNILTDRGYSDFEREYKYPMYQEVAPVACDLTDSCDVFCREDTDCNESQKLSFDYSKPRNYCDGVLSSFNCDCDNFDKPEWLSVFCYVHKNPIYLGKFFNTPKKIEKFGIIKSHIAKKHYFNYQNQDKEITAKILNQYGSLIMTFVPISDSFPSVAPLVIKTPLKDSSHACKLSPVKYRINHLSTCFIKVNHVECQNGRALSIFPYFIQDSNNSSYSMPIVLRDLDVLEGIQTEVVVRCIELNSTTKKFKKFQRNYFQQGAAKFCSNSFSMHSVLYNNTCQNVLVYVQHEFTLNGSDIIKLKVEYGLADVPLPPSYNHDSVNHKYNYLKQKFYVSFFDIMHKSSDKKNFSKDDELLNRGYFIGEELNFGYKSVKNKTATWTKGMLGVFKNGDSCDFSPITFGFNQFSFCNVRTNFSNCSQLRKTAEEKLENLLKGDSLAVYQNLRPPYNNSIPLLRNYKNPSDLNMTDTTKCFIPTGQEVIIQYTTASITDGRLFHRILGVKIDRSFSNFTVSSDVVLTSKVSFLFVSSSDEKSTSGFWKRMFSLKQSENSWLYILNAFDDVTPKEQEEITFWWILLVGLISTIGYFTKFDFTFNELFV